MQVIDPVCKMTIEDKDAVATSLYKGATYYFCSMPCKEDFDKDPESFLGEKGMHIVTVASGAVISAAGSIAGIVYLGRLGTLKSALRRNFPYEGSLSLSPSIIQDRTSHNLYPGITLTYKF